jgi:mono/diheme cytochrome c family protein
MVMQMRYGDTKPALIEDRTDLPPEAIAVFVRQGVGVMPPFRKTEITDVGLAALNAYLASRRAAR